MANLLQELENNENILLLYLADELPAEDRAEVESMLSTDASLQRELDRLRQSMGLVDGMLHHLDKTTPMPQESVVLGRLSQAMSRWKADSVQQAVAAPAKPSFSIRQANWWAVAMGATAATVLIASSLTYLITDTQPHKSENIAVNPAATDPQNSTLAFQNLYQAEDELTALLMADPGGF